MLHYSAICRYVLSSISFGPIPVSRRYYRPVAQNARIRDARCATLGAVTKLLDNYESAVPEIDLTRILDVRPVAWSAILRKHLTNNACDASRYRNRRDH